MSDRLPRLGYARPNVVRRERGGAWWASLAAAAVQLGFVALVHAMYAGERLRLGRAPTPADDSMWPTPLFYLSVVLFAASVPAAFAQLVAAAWVAGAEWPAPRAKLALALLAVPAVTLAVWHFDPVGAINWWLD